MSKNLTLRIIIAAIFGPLIIWFGYLGGWWLAGMVMLFAALGMGEFLWQARDKLPPYLRAITFIMTIGAVYAAMEISDELSLFLLIGLFLCIGMAQVIRQKAPAELFYGTVVAFWGAAYIGFLYPFVYKVRHLQFEQGGHWLLFLFGTLWLSDTLAMAAGKAFGKHKFAPTISPNKTGEGFLGGLLGGIIVAIIMHFWLLSDIGWPVLLGAGLAVSLVGQLGDLVESMWKRSCGIKDSSAIIPGHGGVLDRFDSLLFAAPALYWFLRFIAP